MSQSIYIYPVCVYSVSQLCPTLCNPMNCSPPGSSIHETFQARILEWVAISSSSRGSSQPKDQSSICTSLAGRLPGRLFIFTILEIKSEEFLQHKSTQACVPSGVRVHHHHTPCSLWKAPLHAPKRVSINHTGASPLRPF